MPNHAAQRSRFAHPSRMVVLAASLVCLPACPQQTTTNAIQAPDAVNKPPVVAPSAGIEPDATAERPVDVIIVGAGMAGLTAAKALKHAGRSFIIVEANNRIGGRAWTDMSFATPIDLGGAWIHDVETNPLTPLVKGSRQNTAETNVEPSHHFYFNGRFANSREKERFECISEVFEEKLETSAAIAKHDKPDAEGMLTRDAPADTHLPTSEPSCGVKSQKGDATFDELLSLIKMNAGPLEGAIELSKNATIDAADFAAGEDVLIEGGYGTFVAKYGAEVDDAAHVKLNSRVTSIDFQRSPVAVETDKGQIYYGRKVLVTVSTGVLQESNPQRIRFKPELDAQKKKAIESLPMGLLNKVIMQFDAKKMKYPTDAGQSLQDTWVLYGGATKDPNDDMAFVFQPLGKDIIIGFVGGDRAWKIEEENKADRGEAKLVAMAMKALDDMCGHCNPEAALVKRRVTAWGSEPWTRGAYSAAKPGATLMRAKLAEPVDGRLYFAGEACYNATYNGSYAAAYNSALKASQEMIEDLCATDDPVDPAKAKACITKAPVGTSGGK